MLDFACWDRGLPLNPALFDIVDAERIARRFRAHPLSVAATFVRRRNRRDSV